MCGNSSTVIDNIFSNIEECRSNVHEFNLSDHKAIISDIPLNTVNKKMHTKKRCNINDESVNKVKSDLNKLNWDTIFSNSTPTNIYEKFNKVFLDILNKHCPVKQVNIKDSTDKIAWEDEKCVQQQLKVDLYHDFSRDDPNNENKKNCYNKEKQISQETLRHAKKNIIQTEL